jgi:hypothetical protein
LDEYDTALHGIITAKGKTEGTILYGWVVVDKANKLRFSSAVVAPELFAFWNYLPRGREVVANMQQQLLIKAKDGQPYADLYVLACMLSGDYRLILHQCFLDEKQPVATRNLRMRCSDPIHFVVATCMLCLSTEPFKCIATLLEARRTEIDHQKVKSLCIDNNNSTAHLTAKHMSSAITAYQAQTLAALQMLTHEEQAESPGVLSDDDEAFEDFLRPADFASTTIQAATTPTHNTGFE